MKKFVAVFCVMLVLLAVTVMAGCGSQEAEAQTVAEEARAMTAAEAHALYQGAVEKMISSEQLAFEYSILIAEVGLAEVGLTEEGLTEEGLTEEVWPQIVFHLEWDKKGEAVEMRLESERFSENGESLGVVETFYKDGFMQTVAFGEVDAESYVEINSVDEYLKAQMIMLRTFSADAIDSFTAESMDGHTYLTFELGGEGTITDRAGESVSASEIDNVSFTALIDADGRMKETTFEHTYLVDDVRYKQEVEYSDIRHEGVIVGLPADFEAPPMPDYYHSQNPNPTTFDFAALPEDVYPRGKWTVNQMINAYGEPEHVFGFLYDEKVTVVITYHDRSISFKLAPASGFAFFGEGLENGRYELPEADRGIELEISSVEFNNPEGRLPYGIKAGESTKAQVIEAYGEEPAYHYIGPGEVRIGEEGEGQKVIGEINEMFYHYAFADENGNLPMIEPGQHDGIFSYLFDEDDILVMANMSWGSSGP